MLIPSGQPLFENISSREYYARAGALKKEALDGCVHIVFPDFEEVILFLGGKAVTAVHESKRWLTMGDELLEPAENKAISAAGKMAAYRLSPGLLHVFIHKFIKTMVETELGPYMTSRLLAGYLEGDKSTCILKLQDKRATGYVFLNFGKRVGAVYDSPEGRSYDDAAIKAMDSFREHTYVAIYFIELSENYLKAGVEAGTETPVVAVKPAAPIAPIGPFVPSEPMAAARPATAPGQGIAGHAGQGAAASLKIRPEITIKPEVVVKSDALVKPEVVVKSDAPVKPEVAVKPDAPVKPEVAVKPDTMVKQGVIKPAQAPRPAGVKLIVALSDDSFIGLYHRSRQQTLEGLEDHDVAWVDRKTLDSLPVPTMRVSIVLPDGRKHRVMLKEAAFSSAESRYIIVPRKLRKKLSLANGAMVEITV